MAERLGGFVKKGAPSAMSITYMHGADPGARHNRRGTRREHRLLACVWLDLQIARSIKCLLCA